MSYPYGAIPSAPPSYQNTASAYPSSAPHYHSNTQQPTTSQMATIRAKPCRPTWRFVSALLLHSVALVVFLSLVCLNRWITGSALGLKLKLGLWKACVEDICVSVYESDRLLVDILGVNQIWAQVLALIALLLLTTTFVCGLVILIRSNIHRSAIQATSVVVFIGVACGVISSLLFYLGVYRSLNAQRISTLYPTAAGWLALASVLGLFSTLFYFMEYRITLPRHVSAYRERENEDTIPLMG